VSGYSIVERDVDGYFVIDVNKDEILTPQFIVDQLILLAEYENDETARRRLDALNIRELEDEVADLRARVVFLLDHFSHHLDGGDGTFTFPDGDTWRIP
jgi:hypothetical protein